MRTTANPYGVLKIMIDQTFDANTFLNAARDAFAPVLKAQQEGIKSIERLARLQYAVAGDMLDAGLARVNATLIASTASELLTRQNELNAQWADKLRVRAQEFATVTTEIQTRLTQFGTEMAAKVVPVRKAA